MDHETSPQTVEGTATDAKTIAPETLELYMKRARSLRSRALYDLWEGFRVLLSPQRRRQRSSTLAR